MALVNELVETFGVSALNKMKEFVSSGGGVK